VSWTNALVGNSTEIEHAIRLQLDTGGRDGVVDGPYVCLSGGTGAVQLSWGSVVTLRYYLDSPTPGLTYDFSVEVGAYNDGTDDSQIIVSPLVNGVQSVSKAWLRLERI